METTLHRQLKELFAADPACREVQVDGFRIDAVDGDRLIEIQAASLGAIRDKVRTLLETHDVHVVKPLAARKYLIRRDRKQGRVVSSRYSPARQSIFHLFEDLVHFVGVFPHPRLSLEAVLTEQEEHRLPPRQRTGRRRRRRGRDYRVDDRLLVEVGERTVFKTAADLVSVLPDDLPSPFTTADVAASAGVPRWLAQKLAYCLRQTAAVDVLGKRGNAVLYEFREQRAAA